MSRKSNAVEQEPVDFEDVGKLTRSHVQEPKDIPDGTWDIQMVGFSEQDAEDKNGRPQKLYLLRYIPFEASGDVDEELVNQGGWEDNTIFVRRYVTKPAEVASRDGTLRRFYAFADLHSAEFDDDMDVEETLKAMKGSHVNASIRTREYTNNQGQQVRQPTASNFAPVED